MLVSSEVIFFDKRNSEGSLTPEFRDMHEEASVCELSLVHRNVESLLDDGF